MKFQIPHCFAEICLYIGAVCLGDNLQDSADCGGLNDIKLRFDYNSWPFTQNEFPSGIVKETF